jgi:hypothetical protein
LRKKFSNFGVLKTFGTGGFGEVHLYIDLITRERYARKTFFSALSYRSEKQAI